MREIQLIVYKGRILAILFVLTAVVLSVTAKTQELLRNHDKLLNSEDSKMTNLDVEYVFDKRKDNATIAMTRSKRSCSQASTAAPAATGPPKGLRSLVVLLDISGSMTTELVQLRTNARQIVDEITSMADNPIYNYIFVPFTVPTVGPIVVTRDKNEFVQALQNQQIMGGGCPEYIMEAITTGIQTALAYSTIYVFTDADANESLYSSVLSLVEAKKTPIVFFRTGTCSSKDSPGQQVIDRIAAASNGQVYDIEKSQVGQAFVSSTRTMLGTKYVPELSLDNSNVELLEGDDLQLNCHAKGLSSMVVQWKRLDQLLVEQKFESTGTLPLKIEGVTAEHSGSYVCRTDNCDGEWKKVAEVQVKIPVISVSPKDIVVFENTELVSLQCTTQNVKPEAQKVWIHNGVEIESAKDLEYLQLYNLTDVNEGTYECRVEINGKIIQDSTNLVVKKAVIGVTPKDIVVIENTEMVSLQCTTQNVKPEARKVWFHNGVEIESAKDHEVLHVRNLKPVDDGTYECRVEINGRIISDSTKLTVEFAPKVSLSTNDTVSSPYHQPLTLDCGIIGNPKPQISWSYRLFGESKEKALAINETSLQLLTFIPGAEGFYICEGSNIHGTARRSILLQGEADEPPKIIKSLKKTIYVPSGGRALLNCPCSLCLSLTDYIWTNGLLKFNNTSSDVQNNARVNFTMDRIRNVMQYHLTIDDFSSADEGNYSCILSNAHGTDSFVTQVMLIVEPIVNAISVDDEPQEEEFVGMTDSVHNLTCDAVGVPEPQIAWLVDGVVVENSNRYQLQNDNKTLTLVDGFDEDYSGLYQCIASSRYGTADAKLLLKHGMFPQLTRLPRAAINEEVGQLLEIACEAEGIPSPDVRWFFNGQPLEKNFPFEASLNDSGIYECVADNKYGHIAVNSTVLIHAKPELVFHSSENTTITVFVGNDVALECIVTGFPKPTVTWTFENRSIDEFTNVLETPSGIKISKVSTTNQGSYVCNAKNEGGIVQKLYHIVVKELPKTTTPKSELLLSRSPTGLFVTSFGQVLGVSEAHPSDAHATKSRYIERYPYTDFGREYPFLFHVPARWSPWSEWSTCSATCGTGFQSRSRFCLQPSGSLAYRNHDYCEGESFQVKNCDEKQCSINGGWGSWSEWSKCSRDCVKDYTAGEKSTRSRSRRCDSPAPSHGGKLCVGESYEEETCSSVPFCRVDGGWTSWSQWSPCSETCGFGKTIRWRTCGNPAPRNGGLPCEGSEAEIKVCKEQECFVDGGWSDWNPWSKCSNSSGIEIRIRTRICNNPKPRNGGRKCVGQNVEEEKCSIINESMVSPDQKKYHHLLVRSIKVVNSTQNEAVNSPKPSSCEIGMEYNDSLQNCVDVDECATEQHVCTAPGQICINKNGGYDCGCASGYRAIGTECADIDECREGSRCSHFCENNVGGYTCSCPVGYALSADGRTCVKLRIRN